MSKENSNLNINEKEVVLEFRIQVRKPYDFLKTIFNESFYKDHKDYLMELDNNLFVLYCYRYRETYPNLTLKFKVKDIEDIKENNFISKFNIAMAHQCPVRFEVIDNNNNETTDERVKIGPVIKVTIYAPRKELYKQRVLQIFSNL